MSLIRQMKLQDGTNDSILARVNALSELHVADSSLHTIGAASITLQTNSLSVQTASLSIGASSLSKLVDIEKAIQDVETNQTDKSQYTRLTDGTNDIDNISYEGDNCLPTVICHKEVFHIHLDAQAISADQGFMLIDLSDTSNWPHTNTGHIVLEQIIVNSSISSTPPFVGEIEFGFLSDVNDTNGDLNVIGKFHLDRGNIGPGGPFDFSIYGMDLELDKWFGPKNANDVTWQTDVNLDGPDGATSYPSGDGDFVMHIVNITGGTIDVGVTVFYTTRS